MLPGAELCFILVYGILGLLNVCLQSVHLDIICLVSSVLLFVHLSGLSLLSLELGLEGSHLLLQLCLVSLEMALFLL